MGDLLGPAGGDQTPDEVAYCCVALEHQLQRTWHGGKLAVWSLAHLNGSHSFHLHFSTLSQQCLCLSSQSQISLFHFDN